MHTPRTHNLHILPAQFTHTPPPHTHKWIRGDMYSVQLYIITISVQDVPFKSCHDRVTRLLIMIMAKFREPRVGTWSTTAACWPVPDKSYTRQADPTAEAAGEGLIWVGCWCFTVLPPSPFVFTIDPAVVFEGGYSPMDKVLYVSRPCDQQRE